MILANAMAVRNTLETPVLEELAAHEELEVCFLTPSPEDAPKVEAAANDRLSWAWLYQPAGPELPLLHGPAGVVLRRLAERALMKPLRPWAGFGNLVYRFNERQGFAGHRFKKSLPPQRRAREAQAGNYVDPALGRPLARSRALFHLIHRLYYTPWYSEPGVEAFLDQYRPHLLVIHHLQNQAIRPWVCAARRRGLRVVGIVGSWDQPTTKGPLPPGLARVAVQSRVMQEELAKYHQVPLERIEVTGWPQMDFYQNPGAIWPRERLAQELGLEPSRRLILYGTYSQRLGPHEPGIAAHLAQRLAQGAFGPDTTLVIRPHPKDNEWQERFGHLHEPPRVVALANESGRLDFLATLLAHAGVVLASTGTILLDAVALDTPAVNIAFDGRLKKGYQESIKRWREMDHYRRVIASGALAMVESFAELDAAVAAYLADPAKDAEGRARCRAEQLEPFDGRASRRLAQLIAREAQEGAHA